MLHRVAWPASLVCFLVLCAAAWWLTASWTLSGGARTLTAYCLISVGMSVFAFVMMGVDKWIAKTNRRRDDKQEVWRIGENTLHLVSALGGWIGCLAGQKIFRHKTSKRSFQWVFWSIVWMHACLAVAAILAGADQITAAAITASIGLAGFVIVGLTIKAIT